jgi:hypothetical protein
MQSFSFMFSSSAQASFSFGFSSSSSSSTATTAADDNAEVLWSFTTRGRHDQEHHSPPATTRDHDSTPKHSNSRMPSVENDSGSEDEDEEEVSSSE